MWMKARKIISVLLLGAVLVATNSSIVYAEQVLPDLSRKDCSINISPKSVDSHEIVKNTQFSLWRVGEAREHEGMLRYVLTKDFSESGADLSDLKAENLIERLQNYAESNGIQGVTQKSNEDGEVHFQDIPTGLYLLRQVDIKEGYEVVSPFLVTVPLEVPNEQGWNYHVDASPKAGAVQPDKPNQDKPKPDPETPLPQTGQMNWPVPILAAAGIVLFALGYGLRTKKR